jgi:energy-converting hydrogenase Eha subunit C
MTASSPTADRLSLRLGFWAALGCVVTFVVFTAAFIGLLFVRPLFLWSDLDAYLVFDRAYPTWLPDLARLAMLLFGPLFVVVLNSVYDLAAPAQKSLARLALLFGFGFALLTGVHYFVQLTAVRASIAAGVTDGLVQVVQANPYAAFAALNMLGWTIFLGLATLCAAPVFTGKGLARVIRYALVATGLICLLGSAGYLAQNAPVVFVTMNPAMGGAVLTATVALSVYFRRQLSHPSP